MTNSNLWKCVLLSLLCQLTTALGNTLTVNTPDTVQPCQPTLFTWDGGSAPFSITLLSQEDNSDGFSALAFSNIVDTSFTTAVPFNIGTSLQLIVNSASGENATSAPFTVGSGTNMSCVYDFVSGDSDSSEESSGQALVSTAPSIEDVVYSCNATTSIQWSGGTGPYTVLIQSLNLDIAMEQVVSGFIPSNSLFGSIIMPPGVDVQIQVIDSLGNAAYSSNFTLQSNGNSDCLLVNDATFPSGQQVAPSSNPAPSIVLPTPTVVTTFTNTTASASPSPSPHHDAEHSSKKLYVSIIPIVIVCVILLALLAWYIDHRMKRKRIERAGVQEMVQCSDMGLSPISPQSRIPRRRSMWERLMPTPYILPGHSEDASIPPVPSMPSSPSVTRVGEGRPSISGRLAALLPSSLVPGHLQVPDASGTIIIARSRAGLASRETISRREDSDDFEERKDSESRKGAFYDDKASFDPLDSLPVLDIRKENGTGRTDSFSPPTISLPKAAKARTRIGERHLG